MPRKRAVTNPLKPRKLKTRPLSSVEAADVLRRFGAVRARRTGEEMWHRPQAGGGTHVIPIPPDRKRLATGTLSSIVRLSGIAREDFWRAVHDPHWPPTARLYRDSFGLTDGELAGLTHATSTSVADWCSGRSEPHGDTADRLRVLGEVADRLRREEESTGQPRRPWKWIRERDDDKPRLSAMCTARSPADMLSI